MTKYSDDRRHDPELRAAYVRVHERLNGAVEGAAPLIRSAMAELTAVVPDEVSGLSETEHVRALRRKLREAEAIVADMARIHASVTEPNETWIGNMAANPRTGLKADSCDYANG